MWVIRLKVKMVPDQHGFSPRTPNPHRVNCKPSSTYVSHLSPMSAEYVCTCGLSWSSMFALVLPSVFTQHVWKQDKTEWTWCKSSFNAHVAHTQLPDTSVRWCETVIPGGAHRSTFTFMGNGHGHILNVLVSCCLWWFLFGCRLNWVV